MATPNTYGNWYALDREDRKPLKPKPKTSHVFGPTNGDTWARAEAARKAEAKRKVYANRYVVDLHPTEPPRSLGQVAFEAARCSAPHVHYVFWCFVSNTERAAWEAAAQAVRRAVGR